MPNKTVYIRNDDLDKWDAIKDKPEWLHNHLSIDEKRLAHLKEQLAKLETKMVDDIVKPDAYILTPRQAKDNPELVEQFDRLADSLAEKQKLCKAHGTPLTPQGTCLQKGCKYAQR